MDPELATYQVHVTIRVPKGDDVVAPKVADVEAATENGIVVLLTTSGIENATVNAIAERTDK